MFFLCKHIDSKMLTVFDIFQIYWEFSFLKYDPEGFIFGYEILHMVKRLYQLIL